MLPSRRALLVTALAVATDTFVYGLAVPVLPTLAAAEGVGDAGLGLLFASYAAALLVATPAVGVWVDRAGPRRPLFVGLLALAGATLAFAFARGFAWLMAARALQGASAAVTWTAGLALLAATHAPAERGRAMGAALGAMTAGTLLGPPAAGLLFERVGPRAPFVLGAAVAAADAVLRLALVPPLPHAPPSESPRAALLRPGAATMLGACAAGAMTLGFFEPVVGAELTRAHGAFAVGLSFGVATLASSVAFPAAGRLADRFSPASVAAASLAFAGAAAVALGRAHGVAATTAGLSFVAIGVAGVLAPTATLAAQVAEASDPPAYGAVYAAYNVAYALGLFAGPALGGGLASLLGAPRAEAAYGAATLAAAAAAGLALRLVSNGRPSS
jgi:MFS transporter, DHA1 family, solute carrier family 18 (vesicular amine transporter), member 1/2